jgi:hypothetical protein
VNDVTYLKGVHYWMLEDTSELYGTIRARNGIEFSTGMRGIGAGDGDTDASGWTGPFITAHPSGSALPVEDYYYDRNIPDLQATIESNKQVTTDVLAHKARMRYFKFDVTIMYTPGTSKASVDDQVRQSVTNLLRANYFGQVIQLSDVLQAVHDVPGVDNVRWSSDVPGSSDLVRAYETDVNGNPLTNFILDRVRPGTADTSEKWQGYFTGNPTSGNIVLDWNGAEVTVAFNANAASIQSALRTATGDSSLVVSGTGTSADPFIIDWVTLGVVPSTLVLEESTLSGGDKIYMTDFFLKDDELPALAQATVTGDTVAGLIIRQRAQNTFTTR